MRETLVDIRPMEIDDLSSVYHLGEQLFTSQEFPILYRTWDAFEVTDHFSSDAEYCLVAEVDGKIIGFALATTIEKEGTAWKKYGYLSWIGVHDDYQRIGLGRRLYRRLEQKLRKSGARMIIADTEADNHDALKFFNSIGFSVSENHTWLAKTIRRKAKSSDLPNRAPVGSLPRVSVLKGVRPEGK